MHYEINVTRLNPQTGRSEHWFATHERSIRYEAAAKYLAKVFRQIPGVHEVKIRRIEIGSYAIGENTSDE